MRTTITVPQQAWAMLAVLGVPLVEQLQKLRPDELREVGRLLLWLADYNAETERQKAQDGKS